VSAHIVVAATSVAALASLPQYGLWSSQGHIPLSPSSETVSAAHGGGPIIIIIVVVAGAWQP